MILSLSLCPLLPLILKSIYTSLGQYYKVNKEMKKIVNFIIATKMIKYTGINSNKKTVEMSVH